MEVYENHTRLRPASYLQPTVSNIYHAPPSSVLLLLWLFKWRVLVTIVFLRIIYNLFFHPLRKIPGPFLARASGLWRLIRYFRGTWHEDVLTLHKRYGQVVRISPGEVSFTDQDAIKAIYGHGKHVSKAAFYDAFLVPNMTASFFATRNNNAHRFLRSRVASAYSMTSILTMEPLIQEVMDLNLRKLDELAINNKAFAIDKMVNYFTSDVVGHLAIGGMVGFLEQTKDVGGIIQSIHDGFYFMGNMGILPLQMFWINNPVSKWLTKKFGGDRLNAFDVFIDWLDSRVEERMTNGLLPTQRRDLLQHFIEAKDPRGCPVGKKDVMIEGVNILAAGSDTTAIGILACLGYILTNPDSKAKLIQEIDGAYEQLGLAEQGREITFKEAEKLPYLSAVIMESTRLHPSIQYQLPRLVPSEGFQLGEYFLPPGTTCGTSARAVNCSREIFGSDAEHFRPERWIPQSPEDEQRIKREKSLLMTFGMGSRSCIGKNLATVELYKYIAQFFRHYDAEVSNMKKPWITKTQWFSLHLDFLVTITRREY
ncbi:cytochrome p450 [Fusarium longipes]|uniref:Cytochrome p450 n=1 Tax=Fusarium longipes TaxID=694270 RepID=A0A395SYB6_9HYPO|nr:cytochrome p450 [Fusarium longipes]